ncbi:glycosyltransferase [Mammaliicoccus vitulinus]|uniref:glycosyltransferase n=1 Tax=Mammaliicoccus vitulinus TaxID=71237 RepID=UPI000D1E06EC|nr:glycosyltransferase [Mammaliicoccus vitulinus]PTI70164.1 hypothetical protein BU073_10895 [Mammaliicoccus vitulinus]
MKILHIITSLQSGGAERMLSNIVNNDKDNSHIIVLLLSGKIHYKITSNTKIHTLDYDNNLINKFKILRQLFKIIKYENPHIVQTWLKVNYYAPVLKFLNNKSKYVINIRSGVQNKKNQIISKLISCYLNKTDGQILVSNSAKKEFEKEGISFKKSTVINNGFEQCEYLYRGNIDPSDNCLHFGYVGRYHPIKNQELLIKAFNQYAKNKDVFLHLAGKNLVYENFSNFIDSENKKKFIWYGEVSETLEFYKRIDALILTSRSEGFPNVIGEAMSIGVPVISTDAGESYQIIRHAGYKIENTVSALVEMLEHINRNKKELNEKSEESYKIIETEYSLNKIIKSYKNYYEEIWEEN